MEKRQPVQQKLWENWLEVYKKLKLDSGSSILVKTVWCLGGFLSLNGHSFL
jgi:hypothetical protein